MAYASLSPRMARFAASAVEHYIEHLKIAIAEENHLETEAVANAMAEMINDLGTYESLLSQLRGETLAAKTTRNPG